MKGGQLRLRFKNQGCPRNGGTLYILSSRSTGGEVHFRHGVFEVAFAFRIELAMIADLARAHRGVGGEFFGFKALDLNGTRLGDSFADGGRRFASDDIGCEIFEIHQGNFDVDIDPI